MRTPAYKASITNALAFGAVVAFLSLAGLCAAIMPSAASAQNTLETLGQCMAQSDCLGADTPLADKPNCTAKFCFDTSAKKCQGNTGLCYVNPPKVTLIVPIGNTPVADIGSYIQAIYDISIGVAAVLAAAMMMIGGLQYLLAGGDSSKVSAAKDRITGALIGLTLVSSAYLILNTINPNLVNLQLPLIPVMQRQVFVGCDAIARCKPCGEEFGIKVKKDAKGQLMVPKEGDCSAVEFLPKGQGDVSCVGHGCDAGTTAGKCDGASTKCVAAEAGKTDQCGLVPPEKAATASWICASCTPTGAHCDEKGASDKCCGGFCGDNVCTTGEDGSQCNDKNECKSGLCATSGIIWDGWCSSGKVGMPCNGDKECGDGNICAGDTVGDGYCLPGTKYSLCGSDGDCTGGLECNHETVLGGSGVCMPPDEGPTVLSSCPADATFVSIGGLCTNGKPGAPCSIALGDLDCAATSYSKTGHGQCVKLAMTSGNFTTGATAGGVVGMPGIGAFASLATGISGQSVCTSGELGSFCRRDDQCSPNTFCFTDAGASGNGLGTCVTGLLGSRCHDKCASGLTCNQDAHVCMVK